MSSLPHFGPHSRGVTQDPPDRRAEVSPRRQISRSRYMTSVTSSFRASLRTDTDGWRIVHRHANPLADRQSLDDILTFAYGDYRPRNHRSLATESMLDAPAAQHPAPAPERQHRTSTSDRLGTAPERCSYGLSRVDFDDGAGRPVMGHSSARAGSYQAGRCRGRGGAAGRQIVRRTAVVACWHFGGQTRRSDRGATRGGGGGRPRGRRSA